MARGSEAEGGFQPLIRAEIAELSHAGREEAVQALDGSRIEAVTLGVNIWPEGRVRWQINLIGEHFDGRGNGSFLAGSGWRPTALAQLQIKF